MIARILYGVGAVALVTTATIAAQPGGNEVKGDPNKQICRSLPSTGSRLSRTRSCHTALEWMEIRRQDKQHIEHIQQERGLISPS